MTRHALATAAAVLATLLFVGPLPAATPAPVEVNVILPTTGPATLLGTKEAEALGVLEAMVNKTGGIGGRPLKFVIADDGTDPRNTVQLTNQLIAKNVNVILGSAISAMCRAMEPLVAKSGPVTYCLSPIVQPQPGSYMFSANVGTKDFLPVTLRYFKSRGWTRIAMLMTTDASGRDYEEALTEALSGPEGAGMQIVAREHYNPQDLSVAAQIATIKAANPQVLATFSTGTAFGALLRGAGDSGLAIPIFASASNMSPAQLPSYRPFGKELYFVAGAGAALDPNRGPVHDAQVAYFNAFRDQHIRAEYLHTIAWDPAMIVVSALRKLGPAATPAQIHDYVEGLRGWGGVTGLYDFRAIPQRGLGVNGAAIYRWDPATDTIAALSFAR